MIIHTQGGGELLKTVFETLSYVLYGDATTSMGALFQSLIRIALLFGGFCGLCLAFFRQKFEPLIRSFLIPSLVIVGFLLVPRTSVTIQDRNHEKPIEVTKPIPYSLAMFASWTSQGFYHLQELFVKGAGDPYSWTAKLYSGKSFFDPLKHDEKVRLFCRECVARDLGIGLYSKQDLADALDLFAFLKDKTAEHRAIYYDGQTLSCKQAIEHIALFPDDAEIKKEVALLFLPTSKNSKQFIDLLEQELLHAPQNPHPTVGALASLSILSLRSFFEAILYLIFPLVILISLFSLGIRTLLLWLRMVLWVATWPIFYVAIDLFLNAVWTLRAGAGRPPFTLASHYKLLTLYPSMEVIAAVALATVPIISWLLIQGGFAGLVHLTTSSLSVETPPVPAQAQENAHTSTEHSQQTYAGFMEKPQETPAPIPDTVEHARSEEHMSSFKTSLSSIQQEIRSGAEDVSKSVAEKALSAAPTEVVISSPASHPAAHAEVDQQHTPTHGSWGSKSE